MFKLKHDKMDKCPQFELVELKPYDSMPSTKIIEMVMDYPHSEERDATAINSNFESGGTLEQDSIGEMVSGECEVPFHFHTCRR